MERRMRGTSNGTSETYSIGEVARMAGVTTRALHHYDEIALLRPSTRTAAGYRRYTRADLLRLQRIRLYRALDFGLEDVRALLDAPDEELRAALVSQRASLLHRLEETQSLVAIIDRVLDTPTDTHREGAHMVADEMFKDFRNEEFEKEAEERWGGTDAWKESKRRVASYSLDDWKVMAVEAKAINDALLAHMQAGHLASSPEVAAVAEEHRQHISRWFYDCSTDVHVGLADMYVADPRFAASYDTQAPGFAAYVSEAIRANAEHAR